MQLQLFADDDATVPETRSSLDDVKRLFIRRMG
jgi:hypothetical protein